MGVAINILSAVLKSVVDNKIGNELANELIGISIDGISEKGINMISDYIDRGKTKINYILSKENMVSMKISEEDVDYVVAEIKDLLSKVKITDEVFRQCKYNSMDLSTYLLDEYRAFKGGNIECESEIKKALFTVADALIKLLRESEQFEKDFLIQISNSVDDTNAEIQKVSNYMQENFNKLDVNNQEILVILHSILKQTQSPNMQNKKQTVKSRTQEYADKWNVNMFLNDFDKRDKHAGVNVKLKDVYLESHLPHYIWGKNPEDDPSTDLKNLLTEYIDENNGNKMLLILGQPGIGKSTLITWITANFTTRVDDIMVYQFAADLKDIDWQKSNISYEILEKLGLLYNDLNGKTLILDGLDEISVGNSKEILDKIYWELIRGRNVERFSLIITCRENYINSFERIQCNYITLLPWDEMQIKSFCTLYQEKTMAVISEHTIVRVIENKQILGIPLILYMVLALNIAVEKEGTIVDIYDKIFSLEGGIYDRCLYEQPHRIGGLKKQIHQISRKIAIWMFENNPSEAYISPKKYAKICDDVMEEGEQENEDIKQDFKIGNYFKLVKHCEGVETEELYFVHRSIYEYFVAETIYNSIENAMLQLTEESKKELAGNIAVYLKEGQITNTIGEYLQFKILKLFNRLDNEKQERFYQWWENTVGMMMTYGMFYFTGNNIRVYENIIERESICFVNLLKILRLLLRTSKRNYIMKDIEVQLIGKYIKFLITNYEDGELFKEHYLNFRKMWLAEIILARIDFAYADLRGAYLRSADLSMSNLHRADLRETNLINVNLRKVDLGNAKIRKSNLRKADLRDADLRGTNLRETNLSGANLQGANLKGAYLESSIWYKSDIRKVLSQIKETNFNTLLIRDDNGVKQVNRSELFPDENS